MISLRAVYYFAVTGMPPSRLNDLMPLYVQPWKCTNLWWKLPNMDRHHRRDRLHCSSFMELWNSENL